MFAFAIWDARRHRLFHRPRPHRQKPLYYHFDGRRLVFASEIKAILRLREIPREVDPRALDAYLTYEYIPAPLSIFKGSASCPRATGSAWTGRGCASGATGSCTIAPAPPPWPIWRPSFSISRATPSASG